MRFPGFIVAVLVCACGGSGSTTPPPPPGPAAPTGLVAVPANAQVSLSWTAVAGATGYVVLRATGTAATTLLGTTATTSFVDTTAKNGTDYSYTVRTVDATGESAESAATPAQPFRAICVTDAFTSRVTMLNAEKTNAAPLGFIGPATGLAAFGIAVDGVHGEIFAANHPFDSVSVHAVGASGDAAPLRTFNVPDARYLAYDPTDDRILVSNGTLSTYDRTSTGAAAPVRTLLPPSGRFFDSIALGDSAHGDRLFAVDGVNRTSVFVYHRTDSGTTAPLASFSSTAVDLNTAFAIAYDPVKDEVLLGAASGGIPAILAFPASSQGAVAPSRVLTNADMATPTGLALDIARRKLYVIAVDDTLFSFSADFAASGSPTPDKLTGPATHLRVGFDNAVAFDATRGRPVVISNNLLLTFDGAATGNAAPLAEVTPAPSGLDQATGLAFDKATGEIFVGSTGSPFVSTFTGGRLSRTLAVDSTGLELGLALDATHKELFVAGFNGQISIYSSAASGNAGPLRVLGGANTSLVLTGDVGYDSVNDAVVVLDDFGSISRFARAFTNGDEAPLSTIRGNNAMLNQPQSLYVDNVNGEIYFSSPIGLLVFPLTASGDVAPSRILAGRAQSAFADGDELFVISEVGLKVWPRTASGSDEPLRLVSDLVTAQVGNPARIGICN